MKSVCGVPAQGLSVGGVAGGFRLEEVREIPELRSAAYRFTHVKTGARLIHLYNDDANNLFSIAFRTPVSDSTGAPHILEHSVLCGSKKFPVKDPFQEMLKGSLHTFLNAMTYPDKTVYPVSSQVEKDFYNLVDVYCDAVLNPLLTENTFYQEGWHFDLEDPAGEAGIKGIVYNEMKGVFSDFASHVGRGTISRLFPDISYSHESGGNPERIPDLTYGQFREFHRKFYHPSNSYIFLYGNLPSEKTLTFIDGNYLCGFDRLEVDSSVPPQLPWETPRTAVIEAPAPVEEEGSASVVCSWIFCGSVDPVGVLSGSILSHYLLTTESSPLKRALVDSGLGEDLDDMSGFDSDIAQTVFTAGLRKTAPEHAEAILNIILDTLKKEVERGLDKDLIEGAARQVEFHLREITGGHFPYNIRLADRCYRSWINGGDPFALLAFEKPLAVIKDKMGAGGYFENIIREKLLGNNHRLLSIVKASPEKGKMLEAQTAEQAGRLTAHFTDEDKRRCFELTKSLKAQQSAPPSPEALATLPRLTKGDLPKEGRKVPFEKSEAGGVPLITHPVFTSGIAYLDAGFDFRGLPAGLTPYIPLYLELLTRCGAAGQSYEQMAKRITLATGGIDTSVTCRTKIGTDNELFFMAFIHGKSLEPRFGEMLGILEDILTRPDLTNIKQVRDLLFEARNVLNSSVMHSGHSFAVTNASARLSKSRAVDERIGGITQLRFLDAVIKKEGFNIAAEACVRLHDFMTTQAARVVSLTAGNPEKFTSDIESFVGRLPLLINPTNQVGYDDNNPTNQVGYDDTNPTNQVGYDDSNPTNRVGYDDSNPKKPSPQGVDVRIHTAVQPHGGVTGAEPLSPKKEFDFKDFDFKDFDFKDFDFVPIGIEISSAVNYAARAWKLSNLSAADNGRMFLLSRNLSNGYLWDKIRVEGGAYGGMSGISVSHPVFTCASYRDPNLEETLAHFDKGLEEAAAGISKDRVDQSIVGAIGRVDHHKTPHALGFGETMDILTGHTPEYRKEFREAIMNATPSDLKAAAERVLSSRESAVTVLGSSAAFDKAASNGVSFNREKLLPYT